MTSHLNKKWKWKDYFLCQKMFKESATAQLRDRHCLKLNCFLKVKRQRLSFAPERKGAEKWVNM